jgi:hypothetical protein
MNAPVDISVQRAIRRRVTWHREERDARPPAEGRPVTVGVGDAVTIVGYLPAPTGRLASEVDAALIEAIEKAARGAVTAAATELRRIEEVQRGCRMLVSTGLVDELAGLPSRSDPTGPTTRLLRSEAGITLAALAKGMERDPTTVRKWERGQKTRVHLGDIGRAADVLGILSSSLCEIAWAFEEQARPAVPSA